MKQLTLAFALPPESVITLAIPFTADLTRELVTHMVTAIIAVYHAGGSLTDAHASASSQNYTSTPAAQSDGVSAPVLGSAGPAQYRKPTLAV
jgi:hypothetical protein